MKIVKIECLPRHAFLKRVCRKVVAKVAESFLRRTHGGRFEIFPKLDSLLSERFSASTWRGFEFVAGFPRSFDFLLEQIWFGARWLEGEGSQAPRPEVDLTGPSVAAVTLKLVTFGRILGLGLGLRINKLD